MTRSPVIALLSDFGVTDSYVAQVKAVLLSRAPGVVLVDIAHDIPPGNVEAAAYHLETCAGFFPPSTVFWAVVDPGVGGERPAMAVRSREQYFVGPDNGLLGFLNHRGVDLACVLDSLTMGLGQVSTTFHGRDLFAPAAAHLAMGRALPRLGTVRTEPLLALPLPEIRIDADAMLCHVEIIDRFGSCITSLRKEMVPDGFKPQAAICGDQRFPLVNAYFQRPINAPLCLWGSSGRLELAVNQGSAAARYNIATGATVRLLGE